jgi:hypothetical protein
VGCGCGCSCGCGCRLLINIVVLTVVVVATVAFLVVLSSWTARWTSSLGCTVPCAWLTPALPIAGAGQRATGAADSVVAAMRPRIAGRYATSSASSRPVPAAHNSSATPLLARSVAASPRPKWLRLSRWARWQRRRTRQVTRTQAAGSLAKAALQSSKRTSSLLFSVALCFATNCGLVNQVA